ncbi:MAG: heavy-metal-associated domain-containing protein [Bacteroidetes bacterium]|nr:MAG: heavy-metal-associated domain-containing protein [Bacteroidota bacterium]
MKKQTISIGGMTCGHCVMSVRKELSRIPGLTVDAVQIGKAEITFNDTTVTDDDVRRAVVQAGYTVTEQQ